MDELLDSAKKGKNLDLKEVLSLADKMGVEVREDPTTSTFKGGIQEGRKVVLLPEDARDEEGDILAGLILHELGHIRCGHYGSTLDSPEKFVLGELQANHWALTTKGGYPLEEWDWSILPGITEDLAEEFGLPLDEAWNIAKKVAKKVGVSSSSLQKAGEEVRNRS